MIKNISESEFDATVGSGVVLVDFWASWCVPCKMQSEILESQLAPARPGLPILKVDVDANMPLAAKFGIVSIPALRIFKDGKLVGSFDGVTSVDELAAAIDKA